MDFLDKLEAFPFLAPSREALKPSGILALRLDLYRNHENLAFVGLMDSKESRDLLRIYEPSLYTSFVSYPGTDARLKILVEDFYKPWNDSFSVDSQKYRRLFFRFDREEGFLFNQDHHVHCFAYEKTVPKLAKKLESCLDYLQACGQNYAWSGRWGWLGPKLEDLGSASRFLALVQVSAIRDSRNLAIILEQLRPYGITEAKGAFPVFLLADTEKDEYICLESVPSLRFSSQEQLEKLAESLKLLLHYEKDEKIHRFSEKEDAAWRAKGILESARILKEAELYELTKALAWGIRLECFKDFEERLPLVLRILARESSQGLIDWKDLDCEDNADARRALIIRSYLTKNYGGQQCLKD